MEALRNGDLDVYDSAADYIKPCMKAQSLPRASNYQAPPQCSMPSSSDDQLPDDLKWNKSATPSTESSVFLNIVRTTTTTTTTEVQFKGTVTTGPRMGNASYTETRQGTWRRNQIKKKEERTKIYANLRSARSHTRVQKTCMCKSVGKKFPCKYGDRCRFAHTIDELKVPRCIFGKGCEKYKEKKACKGGWHTEEEEEDMLHIAQCSWRREERRRQEKKKIKAPLTPTITEDYIDCCKFEWPAEFEQERKEFMDHWASADKWRPHPQSY